jgi:hypothetical protein
MSPILGARGGLSAKAYGFTSVVAAGTSYESIATVNVSGGSATDINFTSIPSTYTHLQIRFIAQTNRGTYGVDEFRMQLNSDTAANYSYHRLAGTGSSSESNAAASSNYINSQGSIATTTAGSDFFGVGVIDLLEYKNTNIYKTVRIFNGADINGTIAGFGASIGFASGSWRSTSAITSIKMYPDVGSSWSIDSSFALYGIKGA